MITRPVDKSLFKNYLKKAEECACAMEDAFEKERWNAAVINAVHCCISVADALTVFFEGQRHAGERHEDAIALLQKIEIDAKLLAAKTKQLSRVLRIKTAAEYEEKLMNKSDAEQALKDAKRFFEWAEDTLSV